MANLNVKTEFPRSSAELLIKMVENLLKKVEESPDAVPVPKAVIEVMQTKMASAKAMRLEAAAAAARAVSLNGDADKALGLSLGQTLNDRTTVAGCVALFRDHALLVYDDAPEKLRDYGYDVKITQKATPISKARKALIKAEKA